MNISENSRIWIYQSTRPFTTEEELAIKAILNSFTAQWQAHGQQLAAKAEIRYNRFIILMVDESQAGASGCSIDKSVNLIKEIESRFSLNLFDRFNIAYKKEDQVFSCTREEFEKLIAEGAVTEETTVFNNLVQTVTELTTNWEIPLRDSWHAKVFGTALSS